MPDSPQIELLQKERKALQLSLKRAQANCQAFPADMIELLGELRMIQKHLEVLRATAKHMKEEALVVLLSEYDQVVTLIDANTQLQIVKIAEVDALKRRLKLAESLRATLQAQIKQIEKEISLYGQVLKLHG